MSRRSLFFALLIYCISPLYAQAPDTLWTRTYGGANGEDGYSVQQTADYGYIITGCTKSFGVGTPDSMNVYLIKTDSLGDTLWTKTYGGSGDDKGCSVQQTLDGGYIIVGTTSFGAGILDIYVIKTDSLGDTLWTRTFGGIGYDLGQSIQQISDGGYVIIGSTMSFGSGGYDIYIIKIDSSGDTLWTETYGGTGNDLGQSIQQTSDGGFIIVGYTLSYGAGSADVYLIKTDTLGNTLWTRTYGGTYPDVGHSVRATAGGYIIAGTTESFYAGDRNVYLLNVNAYGDTLWTKTFGGELADHGLSIRETFDGGYIIAGNTKSFGAGSYDGYLIKTDNKGDTLWTMTYGGLNDDDCRSVQQTLDCGYIIAGSTLSFGNDVWLIKLAPDTIGIMEDRPTHPLATALQINPNPFSNKVNIRYQIKRNSEAQIEIYDVAGRLIRSFGLQSTIINLQSSFSWDGTDNFGKKLPSGVYFLEFSAGDYKETKKLILLR